MLRIRGHHLLCILGFRGRGYDSAFVENMGRVVDTIRNNPAARLTMLTACDDICAKCPHMRGGACKKHNGSEAATREMDQQVLLRLDSRSGETLCAGEIYERVATRIETADIDEQLCTDCEWRPLGFCTDGLRVLQVEGFFGQSMKS